MPSSSTPLQSTDRLTGLPALTVVSTIALGSATPPRSASPIHLRNKASQPSSSQSTSRSGLPSRSLEPYSLRIAPRCPFSGPAITPTLPVTSRGDRPPIFVGGGCDDDVMSSIASAGAVMLTSAEPLEVLFEELAELTGQRNAIDGRIVEIVGEIDRDQLWGATGGRWWPGKLAARRQTPTRSPRSRAGWRSSHAAPKACERVDCRPIRSASSRQEPARDPTSTTRSWQPVRRSISCAPRSNWSLGPNL